MSDTAFGGSDGSDINVAGNPAAMTDIGFSMEDITASTPSPGVMEEALSVLGQLFGASPAAAAGIYNGATLIGFLNITVTSPTALSSVMATHGLTINPNGAITNSSGAKQGGIGIDFVGVSLNGVVVQVDTVTGPVNLDSAVAVGTMTDDTGNVYTLGGFAATTWAQITSLNGAAVSRPLPASMDPTGYNSANGVPIMDYANILAMWSKEIAYLAPDLIGGLDGVYSLRTAQRIIPPPNVGAAPLGFNLGSAATFARKFILLGTTAQGRGIVLNAYADPVEVLDPATGGAPNVTFWAYLQVFDGSQQIGLWPGGQPSLAYTGPNPTAAAPGFNTADTVSPIVALTNLISEITTVTTQAAFLAQNSGYSWDGGPEGGGG